MNKHNSVPNIRFNGFEDEWKDKKLGKITKYVKGFAFESKLYTEDGIRIIKVTDLTNKKIKNENGSSTYISETMATKFKKYIIHQKDIIVTTVGSKTKLKSSSVGRAIYIDMNKNYLLNQNLVKLTALSGFDSFFIYSQLEQPKYINYISKIERGNANQANIEIKDLWNYIVKASSIKEQQKIGNLFAKLDKLLDLQQQKIDKLELLKKALLQKLFPKHDADIPELRFKGFNDEWKSYLLGKIAVFINGRAFKQNELLDKGKYPVLRVGNFYTNDKWFYSDLELPEKLYANKGDLLYTWSATFGPHIWKGDKVIYHYHIWKIIFSSEVSKQFALQMLLNDKEELMNNTNGSTMIHLTKNEMEKKVVKIPIKPEQQKIGNLLSKVDQLIELENKKLQNLQQVKKCLLQNMFVD